MEARLKLHEAACEDNVRKKLVLSFVDHCRGCASGGPICHFPKYSPLSGFSPPSSEYSGTGGYSCRGLDQALLEHLQGCKTPNCPYPGLVPFLTLFSDNMVVDLQQFTKLCPALQVLSCVDNTELERWQ